jgi:hypothetical protein
MALPTESSQQATSVSVRGISRANAEVTGIWLVLRIATLAWAAAISALAPFQPIERAIAAWPPSAPLSDWLFRLLAAPLSRRDVSFFEQIVADGYRLDNGTAQFHPLLSWLAMPLHWLGMPPLVALIMVGSLAGLGCLLAFEHLARLDYEPDMARRATLLLAFSPMAFVLFVPYTEGLFLLWAILCLRWARRGEWWLAGLAGALATLTRQQGVFLLLPLAWELFAYAGHRPRQMLRNWRNWSALSLIPAGLLLWMVYRAVALNDLRADWSDPQALIYSLLISPSAAQVVPNQAFLPPWEALWLALAKFARAPEFSLGVDLFLGFGFLIMLGLAWPRMRTSYRLYSLLIVLVSFAYHTGSFFPYMGLPRHLLLAFPVFIGLAPLVERRRPMLIAVGSGGLGMIFMLTLYLLRAWVP